MKTSKNNRFSHWFPPAHSTGHNTRNKNTYHEEIPRTERYKNSPVFYMRRRMNTIAVNNWLMLLAVTVSLSVFVFALVCCVTWLLRTWCVGGAKGFVMKQRNLPCRNVACREEFNTRTKEPACTNWTKRNSLFRGEMTRSCITWYECSFRKEWIHWM